MVKVSLDNVKLLVDVDKEPFFKPSSTTAVSYTHLDVYKRQGLRLLRLILWRLMKKNIYSNSGKIQN